MSQAWAIGDPETVRGFELAGFRAIVAETGPAVRALLERAREQGVRLVVICEAAAALAADALESDGAAGSTLVVVVPGLAAERVAPARERVRRAVRRALGVPEGMHA